MITQSLTEDRGGSGVVEGGCGKVSRARHRSVGVREEVGVSVRGFFEFFWGGRDPTVFSSSWGVIETSKGKAVKLEEGTFSLGVCVV